VVSYIQAYGTLESFIHDIALAKAGVIIIYPSIDKTISKRVRLTILIIASIL
jgi:hypothetical protein